MVPQFNFYDESMPIYTHRYHLPSTKVNQSNIFASMLSDGSIIDRSEIIRSIIGLRSLVRAGTKIEASIVMGADYYESAEQIAQNAQQRIPPIGIGKRCTIRHAIIDKNARIGDEFLVGLISQNFPPTIPSQIMLVKNEREYLSHYRFVTEWAFF